MKKRIFSALIAMVMLLAMVPAIGVASAEVAITWPEVGQEISIGGKTYAYMGETEGGLYFYPSGGGNPVVFSVGDGYILWDDLSTLTLHNATLTETIIGGNMTKVLDLAAGTLILEGENKIEASGATEYFCGLYIDGVYTIKGPGSLEIDLSHTADPSNTDRYYDGRGIVNSGDLLIEGAEISVSVRSENVDKTHAVATNSSLTLKDSKLICNAEGDGYTVGVYADYGLTATDSAILGSSVSSSETEAYIDFIDCYGDVSLTKTVVKAELDGAVEAYGLYADGSILLDQSAVIFTYPGSYEGHNWSVCSWNNTFKESYVNVGGVINAYDNEIIMDQTVLLRPAAAEIRPGGADYDTGIWDETYSGESFAIPAGESYDYATGIMLAPKAFADVPNGAWFEPAAGFNDAMGYFEGTGNNNFSPNVDTTRVTLMVVLGRIAGADVSADPGQEWYEKGLAWAMANGVSDGTNPNGKITREQIASMLYRLEGSPEVDMTVLDRFPDADTISDWAEDDMAWAVEQGIISGKGNGCLDPLANASRAEVAQMIMGYITMS